MEKFIKEKEVAERLRVSPAKLRQLRNETPEHILKPFVNTSGKPGRGARYVWREDRLVDWFFEVLEWLGSRNQVTGGEFATASTGQQLSLESSGRRRKRECFRVKSLNSSRWASIHDFEK